MKTEKGEPLPAVANCAAEPDDVHQLINQVNDTTLPIPDLLVAFDRLATALTEQGKLAQAQAIHQRALALIASPNAPMGSAPFRPRYAREASSHLTRLAHIYESSGQLVQAEESIRLALSVLFDRARARTAPSLAAPLINLADFLTRQNKHLEAQKLYQRAVALLEKPATPSSSFREDLIVALCKLEENQRAQRKDTSILSERIQQEKHRHALEGDAKDS